MTGLTLEGHVSTAVVIDVCVGCQAFWFDRHESLQLSPGSTLRLFKLIGERSPTGKTAISKVLRCPRCAARLVPTHDMQRNAAFHYWRCDNEHGRLITFFDFLREKNFIRPLSAQQIADLRQNVQTVNCSNCGGPIDLTTAAACTHCGSPLSMLDMKQAEHLVTQLKQAAEPRPIDPALPLELARAKREVEASFAALESGAEWWTDVSSSGLVEAGVGAVARWLRKSGV